MILALALVLAAASAPPVSVEDPIARLEATLKSVQSKQLPADLQPLLKSAQTTLDATRQAKSPLLRLYRLREAYVAIELLHFYSDHKDAAAGMDQFTALWKSRKAAFARTPQKLGGSSVRVALHDAAWNRAQKLYDASLAYAKVTSPDSGVYYLGEAEGNLSFARFMETLAAGPSNEVPPNAERVKQALDALQIETEAFYEKDLSSPAAIGVSVRLKEARELLDRGSIAASALTLLRARLDLSRLRSTNPATEPKIAANDSIVALWNAVADEGAADVAHRVRGEVLPLYSSLFGTLAAATPRESVTVTFVRWPYT